MRIFGSNPAGNPYSLFENKIEYTKPSPHHPRHRIMPSAPHHKHQHHNINRRHTTPSPDATRPYLRSSLWSSPRPSRLVSALNRLKIRVRVKLLRAMPLRVTPLWHRLLERDKQQLCWALKHSTAQRTHLLRTHHGSGAMAKSTCSTQHSCWPL